MGSAILQYLMKKVYHKKCHYNYKYNQYQHNKGIAQVSKTMEAKAILLTHIIFIVMTIIATS